MLICVDPLPRGVGTRMRAGRLAAPLVVQVFDVRLLLPIHMCGLPVDGNHNCKTGRLRT